MFDETTAIAAYHMKDEHRLLEMEWARGSGLSRRKRCDDLLSWKEPTVSLALPGRSNPGIFEPRETRVFPGSQMVNVLGDLEHMEARLRLESLV